MHAKLEHLGRTYTANLDKPLDLSMPLDTNPKRTTAWGVNPATFEPVRMGNWVGAVKSGAPVNFFNVLFNPHGNGTHTESVGHIAPEQYPVNQLVKKYFYLAEVITVQPERVGTDHVITLSVLQKAWKDLSVEALVIRHLPNSSSKLTTSYTGTNPTYLSEEAAAFIREAGVDHLLIDLPSVDREEDGGALAAHHAFWNYPQATRFQATISELIYVPDNIKDGKYLLNLQIAPFELDAAPSRPVLFALEEKR